MKVRFLHRLIAFACFQIAVSAFADIHFVSTSEGGALTMQSGPRDKFVIVIQPPGSLVTHCGLESGKTSKDPDTLVFCRVKDRKIVKRIAFDSRPRSKAFVVEGERIKEIEIQQTSYASLKKFLWESTKSQDELRKWLAESK